MRKLLSALLAGIVLAWAIAAFTPANADGSDDIETFTMQMFDFRNNWAVLLNHQEGHCVLRHISVTHANNHARFFDFEWIEVDGERQLGFRISTLDQKLFAEGTEEPEGTAVAIDDGKAYAPQWQWLGESRHGYWFLFKSEDQEHFITQFAKGNKLHIKVPGVQIGSIGLRGSRWGVSKLDACNTQLDRANNLTIQ